MIKIEVTGNSIPEVADKLLAIGRSLQQPNGVALFSAPIPVNSSVSVPEDISPAALEEVEVEVAEAAPANPTSHSIIGATTVDGLSSQPTTKEPSTTPAPAASASEDEELEVVDLPIDTLDFETVVRPLILKVVTARGKPVMEELLSRFGVAKASMIEPALLPELVGLCNEALGK